MRVVMTMIMMMIMTMMMTRPVITWRREDGEKIRMCEHQYSEEDNCEEVAEHTGDSLTLINLNRHEMIMINTTITEIKNFKI